MLRGFNAGLGYFALVFAAGFLLGTLRILAISPWIGDAVAVLVELPIMLAVSWVACGWIAGRFSVPGALAPRLMTGAVAFALLMVAEIGVSVLALGRTVVQHFETYRTTASTLGLLAQVAFALFPVIQLRAGRGGGA